MRYGFFDDEAREYVIDRVDVPFSMTNYLGTQRMGAVVSHNAGGYCWLDSPQYHRITRFRPNGVPMDFPGHYVYLRDDETGKYWSVSWQPTGLPLEDAKYACRHAVHAGRTPGVRPAHRRPLHPRRMGRLRDRPPLARRGVQNSRGESGACGEGREDDRGRWESDKPHTGVWRGYA